MTYEPRHAIEPYYRMDIYAKRLAIETRVEQGASGQDRNFRVVVQLNSEPAMQVVFAELMS